VDRRTLLHWLVATGGLAVVGRRSAIELDAAGRAVHRRLQDGESPSGVLNADETRTVVAVAEQIIPRTDTPGATDAGVAAFVAVMLADWYPAGDAARFRRGLAQFDAESTGQLGSAFADAPAPRQVALVQALDAEVGALRRTDPAAANAHWFGMLKFLTVWGYCTSEVAMRQLFHSLPRPTRYDGAAPVG
jgi:hypothetical protein